MHGWQKIQESRVERTWRLAKDSVGDLKVSSLESWIDSNKSKYLEAYGKSKMHINSHSLTWNCF
jgi:hypothetical protein